MIVEDYMTARDRIIELLRNEGKPLTAREVAERTGLNYNTVRGRLSDLKKAGLVVADGGRWSLKRF
jgi:DNA-binding IclR family transcriptional regulator